jgi:leucine dehydrogenase
MLKASADQMPLFDHHEFDGHEEVAFCHDAASGLKAIIAIHNTNLGAALGGCRMWPYANEDEALTDVLRLSKGMTYKSALAGLAFGGGKAVILGNPKRDKSEALFRAMGRFVGSLGGRYITAEDVGIKVADVETMGEETDFVAGVPQKGSGDPGPATAYGVFTGLKAAVRHKLGRDDLSGVTVAIQGLGSVGYRLAEHLAGEGAVLVVSDIDAKAVERAVGELGAQAVAPAAIYESQAEVFAPCALGGVINDETLPRLKAKIVAGSANNQLAEPRHGKALMETGILYAPDYAINAGGIINISHEGPDYDQAKAFAHVARIGETLEEIFRLAEVNRVTTDAAADEIAERRFHGAARHPTVAA